MRTRRHSEDVASESYTARVDDANGTITREKKHLTQICVHKIGGSTIPKERLYQEKGRRVYGSPVLSKNLPQNNCIFAN